MPSIKRGKLDERAEKGVFVGYAAESKGYIIYSLSRMKIVISRDVYFDENSYWNWDLKKVHKCDQTTPSILEPAVESTSIEDPLDVEATSDTPVLKVRPLSMCMRGVILYMLTLHVTQKLQDFQNGLRL